VEDRVKAEVNRIIDRVLHKKFRESPAYIFVDGLAHTANEVTATLVKSGLKFLRYNSPEILRWEREYRRVSGRKKKTGR